MSRWVPSAPTGASALQSMVLAERFSSLLSRRPGVFMLTLGGRLLGRQGLGEGQGAHRALPYPSSG